MQASHGLHDLLAHRLSSPISFWFLIFLTGSKMFRWVEIFEEGYFFQNNVHQLPKKRFPNFWGCLRNKGMQGSPSSSSTSSSTYHSTSASINTPCFINALNILQKPFSRHPPIPDLTKRTQELCSLYFPRFESRISCSDVYQYTAN